MKLDLYQVDAFTDQLFHGNPACVVPLDHWLPDELLLQIAKENAVAETAFFIRQEGHFHLRWFTPEIEMDLCGHATLAAAHVIKTNGDHPADPIVFHSRSGVLEVSVHQELYTLNFPSRKPRPAVLPDMLMSAIDRQPVEVLKARDFMLVYESQRDVREIKIDRQIAGRINIDPGGIIITAKGDQADFVSRFFTPQASIFEDPVTGSAHCSLIPYWSERLGKKQLTAFQLSERMGTLFCEDRGDRVLISGNARTYSTGTMNTE